jgi:predicted RNA-binding protein with PUA domain
MAFWKSFLVVCGACRYRNLPHRSPRVGIRMALLDELPCCRSCGKQLHLTNPGDRPLVHEVRAQLIHEGLLPQPELERVPA